MTTKIIGLLLACFCAFGTLAQTPQLDKIYRKQQRCLQKGNLKCAQKQAMKALRQAKREVGNRHSYYAHACLNLGNIQQAQKAFGKARQSYQQALGIFGKHTLLVDTLYLNALPQIGSQYLKQKKYKEAEALSKKYLQLLGQPQVPRQKMVRELLLGIQARACVQQKKYGLASKCFAQAYGIFQAQPQHYQAGHAEYLLAYADFLQETQKLGKVETLLKQNLKACEQKVGKLHAWYKQGVQALAGFYFYTLQHQKAERLLGSKEAYLKQQRAFFSTPRGQRLRVLFLSIMMQTVQPLKKGFQQLHDFANMINRTLGKHHIFYPVALSSLANGYTTTGYFAEAEKYHKAAMESVAKVRVQDKTHDLMYSFILRKLAVFYNEQGHYLKAQKVLLEAFDHQKARPTPILAEICIELSATYVQLGRYKQAKSFLSKANEAIKHPANKVLGKTIWDVYKYAVAAYRANYYAATNQLEKLEKLLNKEFRENPLSKFFTTKDHPKIHYHLLLYYCYVAQGKINQADSLLATLEQEWDKSIYKHMPKTGFLKTKAAMRHTRGDYEEAKKLYEKIATFSKDSIGEGAYRHKKKQALLYMQTKEYPKAHQLYQEVIQYYTHKLNRYYTGFTEKEKYNFQHTIASNINDFAHLTYDAHPKVPQLLGELYNFQLNFKGRLLEGTLKLKRQILQSKDTQVKRLYKEWRKQKQELGRAYTLPADERKKQGISLDSLEMRVNGLEKQLKAKSAVFAQQAHRQTYHWQQLKKRLKSDEAIIEIIRFRRFDHYTYKEPVYMALLITAQAQQQPIFIAIPKGDLLEGEYYKAYRNRLKHTSNDYLSYERYFAPIAQHLRKHSIKKLYFSPSGVYHLINIEAMKLPSNRYVFQDLDIQLIASSRDLLEHKPNPRAISQLKATLIANPKYSLSKTEHLAAIKNYAKKQGEYPVLLQKQAYYGALPKTEFEIIRVSQALKEAGYDTTTITHKNAIEEAVKSIKNPQILHIASHGYFFSPPKNKRIETLKEYGVMLTNIYDNPLLQSGLVLAGANNARQDTSYYYGFEVDDGHLNALEVTNMVLDSTDLVVLSACETGLGKVHNGEGVYGLQRAFRVAGCKSVLMSLWKVDDNATKKFMVKFYKHYLTTGNKRFALKATRQEFIKGGLAHPYYWGAFVLVGG